MSDLPPCCTGFIHLKDFVSRETCESNRRKIDIFITEKGLKFLDEINPVIDKSEELMTTNLSEEEKNILTNLLNKIAVCYENNKTFSLWFVNCNKS